LVSIVVVLNIQRRLPRAMQHVDAVDQDGVAVEYGGSIDDYDEELGVTSIPSLEKTGMRTMTIPLKAWNG